MQGELLELRALDPVKMAYLAGFFDGEGCVSITNKKAAGNTRQHVLQVTVAQVDIRPLRFFEEFFGGHIYSDANSRAKGKARPCWQWHVAAQKARPVLEALLPYLIVKRRDAEIALAFLDISHRQKPRTPPTAARVAQRELYRSQLTEIHGLASSLYRDKED